MQVVKVYYRRCIHSHKRSTHYVVACDAAVDAPDADPIIVIYLGTLHGPNDYRSEFTAYFWRNRWWYDSASSPREIDWYWLFPEEDASETSAERIKIAKDHHLTV